MDVTKPMVLVGVLLMLGWGLPAGAAHLAQNNDSAGSPTSFGFGGVADPDPCRKASVQDQAAGVPGEQPGDQCAEPHAGVSGTYVTSQTASVVECLDDPDTEDSKADCGSLQFAAGWGGAGSALCDVEVGLLGAQDNERWVDNAGPGKGNPGQVPDGTWDDGGFGGACHVSGYGDDRWNTNPPNDNNNADTKCEGTAYAEDWLLGADVPILVACDFGEFGTQPFLPSSLHPGLVNCAIGAAPIDERVQCAQDNATRGANQLQDRLDNAPDSILDPETTGFLSCTRDSTADATNLGKGGGHIGDGVTVPNHAGHQFQTEVENNCETDGFVPGDIVIFVSNLVSANPFGQVYDDEHDATDDPVDEHFGYPVLDSDAEAPSDWDDDGQFDGTGDTVVYAATGGWVDHYFE